MAWLETSPGSWSWRFIQSLVPRGFRFDLYTAEAMAAVSHAREAVRESGGATLLPEHLLVGILRRDAKLLECIVSLEHPADGLAAEILRAISTPESLPMTAEIPFSRAAVRVLRGAGREAAATGARVSTAHLLIGLLRHGERAGDTLRSRGVREEHVRALLQS
jgi:ATP-dependent Clp protease ATP-binding subunit ClpA